MSYVKLFEWYISFSVRSCADFDVQPILFVHTYLSYRCPPLNHVKLITNQ